MQRLATILLLLLFMVILALVAAAAGPGTAAAADAIGLEVSPTQLRPVIAAGDETMEEVSLKNITGAPIGVDNEVLIDDGAEGDISIEPDAGGLIIDGSGAEKISLRIAAAPGARAGRRSATLLLKTQPEGSGDVGIAGQVEVRIDVEIVNPVEDAGFMAPTYVNAGDTAVFTMKGINGGKFPTRLEGTVIISGLFGEQTLQGESKELGVGEDGSIELQWDKTPAFALKVVKLTLSTGIGAPAEEKHLLIIFPWKTGLAAAVIFTLVSIATIAVTFRAKGFPRNGRK